MTGHDQISGPYPRWGWGRLVGVVLFVALIGSACTSESEPVGSAQPAATSTTTVNDTGPVETAEPGDDTGPVETAGSGDDVGPVETAESGDDTESVETAEPGDNTEPVETAEPAEATVEPTPELTLGLPENEQGRYAYITAKSDAGDFNDEVGANVIDVFDSPGGEPRVLVHVGPDRFAFRVPLVDPVVFGGPLVLWPLEMTPDNQWIRVQAPVHPQRQSVWVRARDFEFGYTDYRIEIDIAGEGDLTFFDGDTALISNTIVSGRESRPTPLGESYVDGVIQGDILSPAYGSYVLSIPIFNEVLSTFSGVLAKQSIHGTDQPELMGQRVESGHIRVLNEVLSFMADQPGGLVGTRVITVDSTGADRTSAIEAQQSRPWTPAMTADPNTSGIALAETGF